MSRQKTWYEFRPVEDGGKTATTDLFYREEVQLALRNRGMPLERQSFFATLECELLERRSFRNHAEARMAIFEFVEGFYHRRQRHSALGYQSPVAFEDDQGKTAA